MAFALVVYAPWANGENMQTLIKPCFEEIPSPGIGTFRPKHPAIIVFPEYSTIRRIRKRVRIARGASCHSSCASHPHIFTRKMNAVCGVKCKY